MLPHYRVKFETSTAQLFIHTCIGQNNLHIIGRSFRFLMIN